MQKTPFAGLTELDPGESIQTDNASFVSRNPALIDFFLKIGAVTHRHDAHDPLANPTDAPEIETFADGGVVGPDIAITIGYTLIDADGGETELSPIAVDNTDAPYDPPTSAIDAAVDYTQGDLRADTYYYAITLSDGQGGETPIGPMVSIDREPGPANGSIELSGLTDDFAVNNTVAWRLYRAIGGERLGFLASGVSATYTDFGHECVDCGQAPPQTNRTNNAQSFQITVPSGIASGSGTPPVSFSVYASLDGSFGGDCRLGTYPVASAGAPLTYTSLTFLQGSPPDVSTSIRGASRIDAEDLADFYWRSPVPSSGDLPDGAQGDIRLALDTFTAYLASGASGALAGGEGWMPWPPEPIQLEEVSAQGDGAAAAPSGIMFVPGEGTVIDVAEEGSLAVVTIAASAVPGPPGPAAGITIAGSGDLPELDDKDYVEIRTTNGLSVVFEDLGPGSAALTFDASGVAGGSGGTGLGFASRGMFQDLSSEQLAPGAGFQFAPTPDLVPGIVVPPSGLVELMFRIQGDHQAGSTGITVGVFRRVSGAGNPWVQLKSRFGNNAQGGGLMQVPGMAAQAPTTAFLAWSEINDQGGNFQNSGGGDPIDDHATGHVAGAWVPIVLDPGTYDFALQYICPPGNTVTMTARRLFVRSEAFA